MRGRVGRRKFEMNNFLQGRRQRRGGGGGEGVNPSPNPPLGWPQVLSIGWLLPSPPQLFNNLSYSNLLQSSMLSLLIGHQQKLSLYKFQKCAYPKI